MRIVISGTHASGKSTLGADLGVVLRGCVVLGDPYDLLDESTAGADAPSFEAQLLLSAERLLEELDRPVVVAERGPLDFVAYLDALGRLGRPTCSPERREALVALVGAAMQRVDLVVVLPLDGTIDVPSDEDPSLREAMDDVLLELLDDPDLIGSARVVEVVGDADERLAAVVAAIHAEAPGP